MRSVNDMPTVNGGAMGSNVKQRPTRLALRLPGTWVQLDPHRPVLTRKRIRSFVDVAMGKADAIGLVYPLDATYLGDPRFLEVVEGLTARFNEDHIDVLIASARG